MRFIIGEPGTVERDFYSKKTVKPGDGCDKAETDGKVGKELEGFSREKF